MSASILGTNKAVMRWAGKRMEGRGCHRNREEVYYGWKGLAEDKGRWGEGTESSKTKNVRNSHIGTYYFINQLEYCPPYVIGYSVTAPGMKYFPISQLPGFQAIKMVQVIAIVPGCTPEIDGKTFLLKTTHSIEDAEKSYWNWVGSSYLLIHVHSARWYYPSFWGRKVINNLTKM